MFYKLAQELEQAQEKSFLQKASIPLSLATAAGAAFGAKYLMKDSKYFADMYKEKELFKNIKESKKFTKDVESKGGDVAENFERISKNKDNELSLELAMSKQKHTKDYSAKNLTAGLAMLGAGAGAGLITHEVTK